MVKYPIYPIIKYSLDQVPSLGTIKKIEFGQSSDIKQVYVEFGGKTIGAKFVAKTSEIFSKQTSCVSKSKVSNSFQQNAPEEMYQLPPMLAWAVTIRKC